MSSESQRIVEARLIHHRFFAWGSELWLGSRFTPKATPLREVVG